MVEALEVMILSILSAAVKCDWNLSSVEEATITTVIGSGYIIYQDTGIVNYIINTLAVEFF